MTTVEEFLAKISDPDHRTTMDNLLKWIQTEFPNLKLEIKWNQPMFTDHGTFIIGFSAAKQHFAFTPEEATMKQFEAKIDKAGYSQTKGIARIKWTQDIDHQLLKDIIQTNIDEKQSTQGFWRE